jgi:23S rRNA (pseudouridine1915-N3)-methyltransferase|tara:strand:- start:587 stop:1045 length:459 start_codon:yes stop_codon:yes gene_type:complete
MKIIILAHGKIKNGPEFDLISDYVTRFNKQFNSDFLTSLEISESNEAESRFYDKVSRILDGKQSTVLLDRNGEQINSEEITQLVTSFSEKGISQLSFVIGGATGFPKQLISKAKKIIALSRMVFPHKIARLILVEQLYRAKCIINRHPYHKA